MNKNKLIYITLGIVALVVLIIFEFLKSKSTNETIKIENTYEDAHYAETTTLTSKQIIVHITGCVQNQGIVEIAENSRIIDVINSAGGPTEDADFSKINLAYIVKDAQKIYVPSIHDLEETQYISESSGNNVIKEESFGGTSLMININSATQAELEQLPGIGSATATKIINYKNEHGKFKSIEEIKNVPGIGDSKYENIKNMICV